MRQKMARWALSVVAVLGGAIMAPLVAMPTAHATVQDCADYAYELSGEDLDPWLVNDACSQANLLDCYRMFRADYGTQMWALQACERRL